MQENTISNRTDSSKYPPSSGRMYRDLPFSSGQSTNAEFFENTDISSYSHKPNLYPPYVLDSLSRVHYKDQLNNSNVNLATPESNGRARTMRKEDDDQYTSFENDPFVRTVKRDWHTLVHSVEQKQALVPGEFMFDSDANTGSKLYGSWGGEERLKEALLGSSTSTDLENGVYHKSWGSKVLGLFVLRGLKKKDAEHPKVRSRAGYWMSDAKRADVLPFLTRMLSVNPLFPLFLRMLTILFSVASLALASSIYLLSRRKYSGSTINQEPSTIMAIVVQAVAIVYLIYIAYDEYSGKPLGLRNPLEKIRLIFIDLLFIIFASANLALAFNTLYDTRWVCQSFEDDLPRQYVDKFPYIYSMCTRQKALSALLLIALTLWVSTFFISVVRVINKVATNSGPSG